MTDEDYMRLALEEAQASSLRGEVPVGAVLVNPVTQEIVAKSGNAPISESDPTAHAEILALRKAAQISGNYRLIGLTLYVTLEPCTMCAGAISQARLGRVVYGAVDIKGGAVESGVRFFEQPTCHHRPETQAGILGEESADLLKAFFKSRRKKDRST
ncbi:tRNA adenosine(34) deaminase TadA [Litorimonas sp.]|uniref:tRNA adenosine(34) deaminase TadA n=1 Tax=Litorimonas sp. TaxID=1892381 RepID=UPI003A86BD60